MVLYNSIIGLPVFSLDNGVRIANVKDILFCSRTKTVLGLIVEEKGLVNKPKYIPLDEIQEISKTSVRVNGIDSVRQISPKETIYNILTSPNRCGINTQVYLKNGKRIGKISDIVFNFEIGVVDSYIISDGIIDDLLTGRRLIIENGTTHLGKKLLISKESLINTKIKDNRKG